MNVAERNYEPFNQEDAEEERKNFLSVLAAFRSYRYENTFPPYTYFCADCSMHPSDQFHVSNFACHFSREFVLRAEQIRSQIACMRTTF